MWMALFIITYKMWNWYILMTLISTYTWYEFTFCEIFKIWGGNGKKSVRTRIMNYWFCVPINMTHYGLVTSIITPQYNVMIEKFIFFKRFLRFASWIERISRDSRFSRDTFFICVIFEWMQFISLQWGNKIVSPIR